MFHSWQLNKKCELLPDIVWLTVCYYVSIVITYCKGNDKPGKVANPAPCQLNGKNAFFPVSPFAPENLVLRDGFGSPVPRQPAHPHTQAESGAYLRDSSRVPAFININGHTPSSQSRVYRVMQFRTDGGVFCFLFSSHSFWTSMDVQAGAPQEEGNTGFSIHLSAVLALIFLARRIQPFLSLVDRTSNFVY